MSSLISLNDVSTKLGRVNGKLSTMETRLGDVIDELEEFGKKLGDITIGETGGGTTSGQISDGLAAGGILVAVGKLAEKAGDIFSGAIEGVLSSKLEAEFDNIGKKCGSLRDIMSKLFDRSGWFSKLLTPKFALIMLGIAMLVAGIIDLWDTSESFRSSIAILMEDIGVYFAKAKEMIWDQGLKSLGENIGRLFSSIYQMYESSGLKQIFESIIFFCVSVVGHLAGTVLVVISAIIGAILTLLNVALTVINELGIAIPAFVGAFILWIKSLGEKIAVFCNGMKENFHKVIIYLVYAFCANWEQMWGNAVSIFRGVVNKVISMAEGLANGCIDAFNGIIKALNKLDIEILGWEFNIQTVNRVTLPRFAGGGFPNTGEMFIARENGITEMVGRIGARAAVANNDQIVTGIASGVRNAVLDAVSEVAVAMNGGYGNSGLSPVVDVTLKVDSETAYRIVQKGKRKADRRYQVVTTLT